MPKKELITSLNPNGKLFYATVGYKITERVIQREYEGNPHANADGTIDCYEAAMGKFMGLFADYVDSREEAMEILKTKYPTIAAEDQINIELKPAEPSNKIYVKSEKQAQFDSNFI